MGRRGFKSRPELPSLRGSSDGQSALYFARLRLPQGGRDPKRLPAWRFARGADREQVGIEPLPFRVTASSARPRQNGVSEICFGSGLRRSRRVGSFGAARAAACARCVVHRRRERTKGRAQPSLPVLRLGPHGALGHGARPASPPLRFVQAHLQYPHQHSPGAVAQQGPLAHLRRNIAGTKKHPQERGRVRSKRHHLLALASPVYELLRRAAGENTRSDHQRLFERSRAHRHFRRGERRKSSMVQGAVAGGSVLDCLTDKQGHGRDAAARFIAKAGSARRWAPAGIAYTVAKIPNRDDTRCP